MTVAELIKALSRCPDDLMVVVNGYEGGYTEIIKLEQINLNLNVNSESYYGPHDTPDRDEGLGDCDAILLPRY